MTCVKETSNHELCETSATKLIVLQRVIFPLQAGRNRCHHVTINRVIVVNPLHLTRYYAWLIDILLLVHEPLEDATGTQFL